MNLQTYFYHMGELRKLIVEGETLEYSDSDYNHDKEQEFVIWHNQAIFQIKSIGFPVSNLAEQLENNKSINSYECYSVKIILTTLKSAQRILASHIQDPSIETASDNKPESIETHQIINPHIKTASSKKVDFSENKVFIVHGHDSGLLHSVARYISGFNIEPIILQEQIGNGQTIIEKLETNSDVKFAIVLLTPDDLGKAISENELKHRARQNVILELGYFFGKLGRTNVRALYDEKIELPSDLIGIEYIKIDNSMGGN
jgi:predicted nucleotide-binding protein